jgi:hypothetical protein
LLDEETGRQISTNDRTNLLQTTEQNCRKRPKICFNACIIKTKPIRGNHHLQPAWAEGFDGGGGFCLKNLIIEGKNLFLHHKPLHYER